MSDIAPSKSKTIGYWALTAFFSIGIAGSGAMNLSRAPEIMQAMAHLGYPEYFPLILGTWKLLGAGALLAPGTPRLKEWATAGFTFALTGASLSHLMAGDPIGNAIPPLVLLGLCLSSWALRPASRRLNG